MNESDKVTFGGQALPAHVKTDILTTLEPLAGVSPDQWPGRVRSWRPKENLFLLPTWVGPDELYVFLSPEGGRIHIQSMYLRELIDRLNSVNPDVVVTTGKGSPGDG